GIRTASSFGWETLYCGYRYENTTGLFHVRNRVYHPMLGSWLQRDLIRPLLVVRHFRLDLATHIYSYTFQSPLNYVDPSGREGKATDVLQKLIDELIQKIKDWDQQRLKEECEEWMRRNDNLGYDWQKQLKPCPCSQADAEEKKDYFSKDPNPSFHKGCDICFRGGEKNDINPLTPANPGQQCCYKDGKLITGGTGAGTPDRFGPQGPVSVVLHFEQDVQPAIICGKAGMIDEYYKRRSPDPGKDAQGNPCPENVVNG
ncbi:MAG: hypothetical protein JNM43_19430, partial [Planctomycetaceae bacterium]|nr:hypothetical protein [Planctomycetaceae bacterium]